ncbi:MAG: LuxR C-terminal-related transcriptional regulator [bacterium]
MSPDESVDELLAPDVARSLDASTQRRRLVEAICAVTDSTCGFCHETLRFDRRLVFADIEAVGPEAFRASTLALAGRSVFEYVRPLDRDEDEAWPGDVSPVDRFAVTDRRQIRMLGAWPMLWQPARVRSMIGMSIVHDGQLLGALLCARRLGEAPFGRSELTAVRAIEDRVRELYIAAWRRTQATCNGPDIASFLVFDADGRHVSTSIDAAPWLDSVEMISRLGALAVSLCKAGGVRAEHFVRRARVRLERLDGAVPRVLALIDEGDHHRPGAREKLTDAQRKVADLAVAGATAKEIASALDRSPETVRDHLKAIYIRLGIGSRVELSRVLGPPPPAPADPDFGPDDRETASPPRTGDGTATRAGDQ